MLKISDFECLICMTFLCQHQTPKARQRPRAECKLNVQAIEHFHKRHRPSLESHSELATSGALASPISAMARMRSRTSLRVCAADRLRRSRLVPAGTVGGRMAGTWNPRSQSSCPAAKARSADPTITGKIGDWGSAPSAAPTVRVCSQSSARRSGSCGLSVWGQMCERGC